MEHSTTKTVQSRKQTAATDFNVIPFNMYESAGELHVTALVPCVNDEDDISVSVKGTTLTIEAEPLELRDVIDDSKVYAREYTPQKWTRNIELPDVVNFANMDVNEIKKDFINGELLISMPLRSSSIGTTNSR